MTRVVVSYRGADDPSDGERAAMEGELGGIRVVDRMAGAVLVEGTVREVRARLAGRDADWLVTEVGELRAPAPHRAKRLWG
jgi:hypothetical protein